jgi:hypothetical protein
MALIKYDFGTCKNEEAQVGLFAKRSPKVVDGSLPDGAWLGESREMFKATIEPYYGSPETMAKGAEDRRFLADYGTALFFYAKSIDMLHTAYGFSGMERRRPSGSDAPIIEGFAETLSYVMDLHPQAPVDECVREVTHRLRSISTECDRVGVPSELYRDGLDRIARIAPHVPVDDIFWT